MSKVIKSLTYNSRNRKKTDDEFYTRRKDIEDFFADVNLKGLKIYCPCDSENSEFVKYFKEKGYNVKYTSDEMWGHEDLYRWCDIVITNPPFRGVTTWVKWLHNYVKKPYILILPIMSIVGYRCKNSSDASFIARGDVDCFIGPNGEKRTSRCKWITSAWDLNNLAKIDTEIYLSEKSKKNIEEQLNMKNSHI